MNFSVLATLSQYVQFNVTRRQLHTHLRRNKRLRRKRYLRILHHLEVVARTMEIVILAVPNLEIQPPIPVIRVVQEVQEVLDTWEALVVQEVQDTQEILDIHLALDTQEVQNTRLILDILVVQDAGVRMAVLVKVIRDM